MHPQRFLPSKLRTLRERLSLSIPRLRGQHKVEPLAHLFVLHTYLVEGLQDRGVDVRLCDPDTRILRLQESVRVLIGSTRKMGTGTDVQKHLVARHQHESPGWRP